MKKIINWKLFFLLGGICIVTGVMVMPFTFALAPLPDNAPVQIIITAQFAQTLVLSVLASFFGLLLARLIGFGVPILEGITGGEKRKGYLKSILSSSIIWGILGGMLTAITGDLILRAVLLNGTISIIYGWLYWKKGLELAMIGHFSTDIVMHILIPHVIAPLFI